MAPKFSKVVTDAVEAAIVAGSRGSRGRLTLDREIATASAAASAAVSMAEEAAGATYVTMKNKLKAKIEVLLKEKEALVAEQKEGREKAWLAGHLYACELGNFTGYNVGSVTMGGGSSGDGNMGGGNMGGGDMGGDGMSGGGSCSEVFNVGDEGEEGDLELFVLLPVGSTVKLKVAPNNTIDNVKWQLQGMVKIPHKIQELTFGVKELLNDLTVYHYQLKDGDTIILALGGLKAGASKRVRPPVVNAEDKIMALIDAVQGQEFAAVNAKMLEDVQSIIESGATLMEKLTIQGAIHTHVKALDAMALNELVQKLDSQPKGKGGVGRYATLAKIGGIMFPELDDISSVTEICSKARQNMINMFNADFARDFNKVNVSDMVP